MARCGLRAGDDGHVNTRVFLIERLLEFRHDNTLRRGRFDRLARRTRRGRCGRDFFILLVDLDIRGWCRDDRFVDRARFGPGFFFFFELAPTRVEIF